MAISKKRQKIDQPRRIKIRRYYTMRKYLYVTRPLNIQQRYAVITQVLNDLDNDILDDILRYVFE